MGFNSTPLRPIDATDRATYERDGVVCLRRVFGSSEVHFWRIALSVRVFGDDVRWAPRPDCLNIAGVSFDEMLEGERPGGDLFPLLWSSDGRRDGDAHYPRGFATRWQVTQRRDEVNEGALFNRLRKAER
jgi:hypothetical protein